MAGLYTEGESKILSGVYSLILAISTSITSGGRGIVAYPFTADWGPVNELTTGNLRELRDKLYLWRPHISLQLFQPL